MPFLREQPPLPLYFPIIAAQTIDARDAELVAGPEPCQQVFVPGTAEVLARHPVGEDPVPGDACRCRDRCWRSAFWSVLDTRA